MKYCPQAATPQAAVVAESLSQAKRFIHLLLAAVKTSSLPNLQFLSTYCIRIVEGLYLRRQIQYWTTMPDIVTTSMSSLSKFFSDMPIIIISFYSPQMAATIN